MSLFVRSILLTALAVVSLSQNATAFEDANRYAPSHPDRQDRDYGRDRDRDYERDRDRYGDYLCIGVRDARYGSQPFNEVHARVSSRRECIQHCYQVIRWEDRHHWEYDRWNMCWYDDNRWKGFIFP